MTRKKSPLVSRKHELPLKGDSGSVFLQVMTSISVFLFALSLAGVLAISAMLRNWNNDIMGSLTVQIMPVNTIDKEQGYKETLEHQAKVVEFLKKHREIEKTSPLDDHQLSKLIRPWLGDNVHIENLPIPRLIDVRLKSDAIVNFDALAESLAQVSPFASIDNHKLWLNKLIRFADGIKMLAITVLLMVIAVTGGVIFYTTQTSLGLNAYTIGILHQMGAKDTYIAQQYARRTAFLSFVGGVIGLAFAIPAINIIASLSEQIQGGIISEAELSVQAWLAILVIPFFSSLVATITAYWTVKKTLGKMV